MDTPQPQYFIIPSTYSGIISVISVMFLFALYVIYIGYLASYNLKFYPNIYMLWNLLTSGNNVAYQTEFEQYVRMVVLENQANMVKESFATRQIRPEAVGLGTDPIQSLPVNLEKERINTPTLPSWLQTFGQNAQMIWNQLILSSFINGKKVKVTRSL